MKKRTYIHFRNAVCLIQSVRQSWALRSHKRDRGEIGRIHSRFAAGLIVALALSSPAVFAAKDEIQSITPVQAELMADMNARLLKAGEIVYARVTVEWQGADCFPQERCDP